jgi:F-type H+-transporting ATPase subunit delta
MSNYIVARPYAKAIFDIAVENNTLQQWSEVLAGLATTAQETVFINFIINPRVTAKQRENLLVGIVEQCLGNAGKNFIQILANNQRLDIFPELAVTYEQMRTEYENITPIKAIAAYPLTAEQQTKLELALQKRLQKKVALQYTVDQKLLGGMMLYIGDTIIDGSLRNKLDRLKQDLGAI